MYPGPVGLFNDLDEIELLLSSLKRSGCIKEEDGFSKWLNVYILTSIEQEFNIFFSESDNCLKEYKKDGTFVWIEYTWERW